MQRLGKQIELLRTRLGMSQNDLAERTRLSRAYVRDLELGKEMPNLEILLRIAVTLGAEPREMFLPIDNGHPSRPAVLDEPAQHLH